MEFSRQGGSQGISPGTVLLQTLIRWAHQEHKVYQWRSDGGSREGEGKHCFEFSVWISHLKLSSSRVVLVSFVTWEETTSIEELS